MGNITIVGSQWGDEGKGKIVDWLASRADVIVRFQGGHNAGHTLVIGNRVYKLHVLPSGVVRPGKLSVIGNGVVIEPWALMKEISELRSMKVEVTPENLLISESAPIILPFHGEIDRAMEEARGHRRKLGTTGRGIGPAYEDKVGRRGLRMCDLAHPETLHSKVESLAHYHNELHKLSGTPPLDVDGCTKTLKELAPQIIPFVGSSWQLLDQARKEGKTILFEGAQGIMLDIDHGTYPFVTSSNTVAANAAIGTGVGVDQLGYVLGITKAYTTRVGAGPFPTELNDQIGEIMTERGAEFGTTTGRKRRCGWFDAVQVRQAVKTSGIRGIALTKMDVLDTLQEVKICVGYEHNGKTYNYLPASSDLQAVITPVYEAMSGWQQPLKGNRLFNKLPPQALNYINRISELIEVPVAIVSTGPEREDTIQVKDLFSA